MNPRPLALPAVPPTLPPGIPSENPRDHLLGKLALGLWEAWWAEPGCLGSDPDGWWGCDKGLSSGLPCPTATEGPVGWDWHVAVPDKCVRLLLLLLFIVVNHLESRASLVLRDLPRGIAWALPSEGGLGTGWGFLV